MARYAMLFDITKCTGCYNCFLACKDEHCGNEHLPIAKKQPEMGHHWMNIVEKERGQYPKVKVASIPVTCMQCEDAPCVAQARDGAAYRRADGIVIIDPVKSRGQRQLVEACPYGAIYWNQEENIPQKCTMCAHLLDQGWKEPRCVESCPTGAILFGDLEEAGSGISGTMAAEKAEILSPEEIGVSRNALPASPTCSLVGAIRRAEIEKPANRYIGLPKKFIAGTVQYADIEECAEDVRVTIKGDDFQGEARTNAFGDFEFEGLSDDTDFEIAIIRPEYKSQKISVRSSKDVYLGTILLQKQ